MSLDFALQIILKSTVFGENNGAPQLEKTPNNSPRNKNIAFKYHIFQDKIGEEKVIGIEKLIA